MVNVYPKETSEVLVNPGMGWTTFHSFNDDEVNKNYPESSIAYFRFYWDTLEPNEGEYRWDIIDEVIEKARRNNQDIALRVSAMNGMNPTARAGSKARNYRVPEWFRNSGCRGKDFFSNKRKPDAMPMWEPDYGDPIFLEKKGRLIAELGKRYDGHPGLDHVDIGTLGRWGEWHCAAVPMPSVAVRQQIIDIYLSAFKQTPLLMLIGNVEGMAYAVGKGTGWRADCMGDSRQGVFNPDWKGGTPDFNHMDDIYLQHLVEAKAIKAWKKAPVAFETCWALPHWYEQGWNIDHIFAYTLALHTSVVNGKSQPVPEEWWPQVDDFSRKMGYRFVLKKMEYPESAAVGATVPLSMVWENRGVAPCYRKYALAFRIQGGESEKSAVLLLKSRIDEWLPGRLVLNERMKLPSDCPKGSCVLSVAVVDTVSGKPAVRLAMDGRQSDGWYPIGDIRID